MQDLAKMILEELNPYTLSLILKQQETQENLFTLSRNS